MKRNPVSCILNILMLTLTCFLFTTLSMAQGTVVAEYNGKEILDVAVWTPVPMLKLLNPEVTDATLTEVDLENASRQLRGQIRRIMYEEAFEDLGIQPDPEDVEAALQELLKSIVEGSGKSLVELQEYVEQHSQAVVAALRAIQANQETAESAYEKILAPAGVDEHTWEMYHALYSEDSERTDVFEASIPEAVDDTIMRTRESVKRSLQHALLDQYFAAEKKGMAVETSKAMYFLDALENAEIVIHDENLIGAVDVLKEELEITASCS